MGVPKTRLEQNASFRNSRLRARYGKRLVKMRVRRGINITLPLLGMVVIFGSVLFGSPSNLQLQVILLLLGVLILEAGVWSVTSALLPNGRRHPELRHEVDLFLEQVGVVNAAARARDDGREDDARFQAGLEQMRLSVERMGEFAGRGSLGQAGEAPTTETTEESHTPATNSTGEGGVGNTYKSSSSAGQYMPEQP
jgi:hypothetical protein